MVALRTGAGSCCRYGDGVRFAAREELIVDNAKLRQLFKAAVRTGQPKRHRVMSSTESFGTTLDPWFDLMEASAPSSDYDPGYTGNPYRGEHLTIPCVSEEGSLFTIEVSFHKGTTFVDVVGFEAMDGDAVEALENAIRPPQDEESDWPEPGEEASEREVFPERTSGGDAHRRVGIQDPVPVGLPDPYSERAIDELVEHAAGAAAHVRSLRAAFYGLRPRVNLRPVQLELAQLYDELRSTEELLRFVAEVFEVDPPLAAEFPDGEPAGGVLSPRQLAYLVSLGSDAANTVRYSELLEATTTMPRLEQELLDRAAVQEELERRMQSTCERCGSGPGQACRTVGGKDPGSETEMHKGRGG